MKKLDFKNNRKNNKYKFLDKKWLIFLVVTTLFMCVGYATINSTILDINGISKVVDKNDNLYISSALLKDQTVGSTVEINNYFKTIIESSVTLPNNDSYATVALTIYNDSSNDYIFSNVVYDTNFYSNEDIEIELIGLDKGFILDANSEVSFDLRFKYKEGIEISNNTLDSFVNLKFYKRTLSGTVMAINDLTDDCPEKLNNTNYYIVNGIETKKKFCKADDNYGETYYFRGAADNNYVSFANKTWRIMRVNGDNSVRLILDGTTGGNVAAYTSASQNNFDNAYAGYMYGETSNEPVVGTELVKLKVSGTYYYGSTYTFNASSKTFLIDGTTTSGSWGTICNSSSCSVSGYYTCLKKNSTDTCKTLYKLDSYVDSQNGMVNVISFPSTSYEQAQMKTTNSNIKSTLDAWYNSNLLDYSDYIGDMYFYNDMSTYLKEDYSFISDQLIHHTESGNVDFGIDTGLGFGSNITYYGSWYRLVENVENYWTRYSDGNSPDGVYPTMYPTYYCRNNDDCYTSSDLEIGNNKLQYPITSITFDDAVFAGSSYKEKMSNSSNYIYISENYHILNATSLDAWSKSISLCSMLQNRNIGGITRNGFISCVGQGSYTLRPVINIKENIYVASGDGTASNPYELKFANPEVTNSLPMAANSYVSSLANTTLSAPSDSDGVAYSGKVETESGIRYEGKNPNNYVIFNDEYWRIIGVFGDESHGINGKQLVKLVKDTPEETAVVWNDTNSNNWNNSSLNSNLNSNYYNSISLDYKVMIQDVSWQIGTVSNDNSNVLDFYTSERNVASNTKKSVGLINVSDYGYAVSSDVCSRDIAINNYSSQADCYNNNWLYNNYNNWTITPYNDSSSAYNISNGNGSITYSQVGTLNLVTPVIWLKDDVVISKGRGTKREPFELSYSMQNFSDYIKTEVYTGTQGENGIYLHDNSLDNSAKDGSYRYSGQDPDNYVCFGTDAIECSHDNLYRIIGVFDNQVKLIKADYATTEELGINGNYSTSAINENGNNHQSSYIYISNGTKYDPYHYSTISSNNWTISGLNNINLNTNFINYLGDWSELISNHEWIVGGALRNNIYNSTSLNAYSVYNNELTTSTALALKYTSQVGLMYVSDYVYASSTADWTTSPGSYGPSISSNNWLFLGDFEFTITPEYNTTRNIYRIWGISGSSLGKINYGYSDGYAPIRPTFYLNSNVKYFDGNGTKGSPYRVKKENLRTDSIDEQLSRMTLDEKIGQMIIMSGKEIKTTLSADNIITLETVKPGGVIIFGNYASGDSSATNISSKAQLKSLMSSINEYATIPLIWSIDQEGGVVQRLNSNVGATIIPKMYKVGSKDDLLLTKDVGRVVGEELKVFGFNMDFAPVADIWSNSSNTIIGERAFGTTYQKVSEQTIAFNEGLESVGVTGVYKHFPGHGDTGSAGSCSDSHYCLPYISKTKQDLLDFEIKPFKNAIDNGAKVIMVGHLDVPSLTNDNTHTIPTSLSRSTITDFLKNELGFSGLVITDALDMGALTVDGNGNTIRTLEEVYITAINAGVDLLLSPANTLDAFNYIKNAVNRGDIDISTINNSVRKILEYKNNYMTSGTIDESFLNNSEHQSIINSVNNS